MPVLLRGVYLKKVRVPQRNTFSSVWVWKVYSEKKNNTRYKDKWREVDACREEVRRKMKEWSVFFCLLVSFHLALHKQTQTPHPTSLPSSLACLSESYCVSAGELQLTCCHSLHHSPWANYSLQQLVVVSFCLSCMLSAWAQKGGCFYFCLFVSLSPVPRTLINIMENR